MLSKSYFQTCMPLDISFQIQKKTSTMYCWRRSIAQKVLLKTVKKKKYCFFLGKKSIAEEEPLEIRYVAAGLLPSRLICPVFGPRHMTAQPSLTFYRDHKEDIFLQLDKWKEEENISLTPEAGAERRRADHASAVAAVSVLCSSSRAGRRLFLIPSLAADPSFQFSVPWRYDFVMACWGLINLGSVSLLRVSGWDDGAGKYSSIIGSLLIC